MRRGHPGIGNWRGENLRHYRPRSGGTPHFRPTVPFGPLEPHRFPPLQRYRGPRPYNPHYMHSDEPGPPEHERQYRGPAPGNMQRPPTRGHHNQDRQILPLMRMRVQDNNLSGNFNNPNFFGDNYNVNNMGDIDHRPHDIDLRKQDVDLRQQNSFGPRPMSPWVNPPFERRYNNDQSPHKTPKHHNMGDSLLPMPDYSGHRPPSSDHYSGTTGPNNNNNPYSHSVDDTVDIVRKRLQNRDSQEASETTDSHEMDNNLRHTVDDIFQDPPREQPAKKRTPRQRPNIKSNCDKIKTKIVHQMFKMDKGKIHKLMDNPSSSSKFEYAISSLITESQNSLNRHMRSVAEKSLTASSSSDFVHDDNNTIYEDTFMRQMQGVLDPQDTVLLEDIKPLVLAELSKVLSLDDFERIDDYRGYSRDEQQYGPYFNEPSSNQYPHNSFQEEFHDQGDYASEVITGDLYEDRKHNVSSQPTFEEPAPQQLFERRPPKKLDNRAERSRSRSTESWQPRKSTDNNSIHNNSNDSNLKDTEKLRPLFESMNHDQLSDDEDPFADLDNQYHVAVDHNFIDDQEDGEIISLIPPEPEPNPVKDAPSQMHKLTTPNIEIPNLKKNEHSTDITKEINNQLQSIAKSPIKLFSTFEKDINTKSNVEKAKQEIQKNVTAIKEEILEKIASENVNFKDEPTHTKSNDIVTHANESGKLTYSHSRKRSVDSKPAHRKEKRKKSSHSECQEAAKSILTMFYDNKSSKDSKHSNSNDKEYSDKYVKRKEAPKKTKDKVLDTSNEKSEVSKPKALEVKKVAEVQRPKAPEVPKLDLYKKQNSNTSHSMVSPKDTTSTCVGDQTKSEKVKLTAIDIFSGIPKKGSHQSLKNTTAPLADGKIQDENKIKPVIPMVTSFARKLSKRHVGTQVIKKMRHKESQTPAHKRTAAGTQTDPVKFDKSVRYSSDPLERMKEIDMEIQMLLQEKFKLYNSMETKNKNSGSSLGTLGMAVLNVPVEAENEANEHEEFNADSIAEDFTNLPAEELEQIALESLEVTTFPVVDKRTHRIKTYERTRRKSESPARYKKSKTPNISLLEQIITDDRPIEEIISLDDLEDIPVRSKKKSKSKSGPVKKKSSKKNPKPKLTGFDISLYNLKPCSVILERIDMDEYLRSRFNEKVKEILKPERDIDKLSDPPEIISEKPLSPIPEVESVPQKSPSPVPTIEETSNDIQIDMMDVSEDIVIGDEVKNIADEIIRMPISEEIILDNSQSSAEFLAPEPAEGECKMYDYSTDDTLKRDAVTVTGNGDAVLAIECIDNSFVAACLNGNVYHFSTDGKLLNTLRGSNLAITCLTIVKEKYGTTVYTGSLDSRIRYYDLDTGLEKGPECNVLSPIQTMDRAWDTVFVGTRTGFVLQFECKNNMLIPVSTVKFSEQSILALRAMKEGARKVLLVAARSDCVTIKDAQTGLLLRTLEGPKMTVYSLLFEDGKVYCGTSSHQIHVFDYASGSHVHAHLGGKGAVCLRARGGLVFAGCYDGCVYVYREAEARPLAQLRGPALMLLSLAIDGTKIIAGYKDRSLYIWKIPLAVLQEMIL